MWARKPGSKPVLSTLQTGQAFRSFVFGGHRRRGWEGARRHGRWPITPEELQEGTEIDDLSELGNEATSTEREGAAKMTSRARGVQIGVSLR